MAVISQTTPHLSPFAQLEACATAVVSIFTTLAERTDTAFKRVHVQKRDESGNIRQFERYNERTDTHVSYNTLTFIEDQKTGELYYDEPFYIIAIKCSLIMFGMLFYTFGKICWYASKTPIEITTIAIDTFAKAGQELAYARLYEFSLELRKGCDKVGTALTEGLFEIIKAPFFGLGAVLATIYGIIKPYHGRKIEAMIEHAWQRGASYKEDFRNVPARPNENCWQAFMRDIKDSHPFYLAHCFQVRGNINDHNIVLVRREEL